MKMDCPDSFGCACEQNPFVNLSSAEPDKPIFFAISYLSVIPPLGTDWSQNNHIAGAESVVSQQAANQAAYRNAFMGATSTWLTPTPGSPSPPTATPTFSNVAQTATVFCPDGLSFSYTIGAGQFVALSQSAADAQASSEAARQAVIHQVCLSSLQPIIWVSETYNLSIQGTGLSLDFDFPNNDWELVSGSVPSGTSFVPGGSSAPANAYIQGSPTTPGTFLFTVRLTDPEGDFMQKLYSLKVDAQPTLTVTPGYGVNNLTWSAVESATNYIVLRGTSSGVYTPITTLNALVYADTTAVGGTTYYYAIQAVNGATALVKTAEHTGVPLTPAAPTLTATAGDTAVALSWTASTGATGYKVYRGTASGGPYGTLVATTAGLSANDTGLSNGTTYYYVVVATVNATTSANSTQKSAMPYHALNFNELTWTPPTSFAVTYKQASFSDSDLGRVISMIVGGGDGHSAVGTGIDDLNSGTIVYTGPSVGGTITYTFSSFTLGLASAFSFRVTITSSVDGVLITHTNTTGANGGFAFTVPASTNATLTVSWEIIMTFAASGTAPNMVGNATITP